MRAALEPDPKPLLAGLEVGQLCGCHLVVKCVALTAQTNSPASSWACFASSLGSTTSGKDWNIDGGSAPFL